MDDKGFQGCLYTIFLGFKQHPLEDVVFLARMISQICRKAKKHIPWELTFPSFLGVVTRISFVAPKTFVLPRVVWVQRYLVLLR